MCVIFFMTVWTRNNGPRVRMLLRFGYGSLPGMSSWQRCLWKWKLFPCHPDLPRRFRCTASWQVWRGAHKRAHRLKAFKGWNGLMRRMHLEIKNVSADCLAYHILHWWWIPKWSFPSLEALLTSLWSPSNNTDCFRGRMCSTYKKQ